MQKKLDIKGMTGTVLRGRGAQALLSVPDVCYPKALPDETVAYVKLCGEVRDSGLQAAVETKSYAPVYIQTIENELCDEGEQEG